MGDDQLEPDGQDDGRVFVDVERLRELPGKIDTAVLDAVALAQTIASLQDAGADLGVGEYSAPALLVGSGLADDPTRTGLARIAIEAPDMAAEIRRRITYFESAEEAVGNGFEIDQTVWLEDAPPFDLARVRTTVADLKELLAGAASVPTLEGTLTLPDPDWASGPSLGTLRTVRDRLAALSPAERQAVLGALRGTPLTQLGDVLSRVQGAFDRFHGAFGGEGEPTDTESTVLDLEGLLLSGAPTSLVPEIVRQMPYLQPSFDDTGVAAHAEDKHGGALYWAPIPGPLTVGGFDSTDVKQQLLGDCFFMANLSAVAGQNPYLLRRNMRDNGNGTVTVTFYRDGAPVEITVTKEVPVLPDNSLPPFASAANLEGQPETWVAIYEKAYARFHGSYGNIHGGSPDEALAEITGLDTDSWDTDNHSPDELREKLDQGYSLSVSTGGDKDLFGLLGKGHGILLANHAYAIVGITSAGDVQLRNPWGGGAVTATLSWDQFQSSTDRVYLCPPG